MAHGCQVIGHVPQNVRAGDKKHRDGEQAQIGHRQRCLAARPCHRHKQAESDSAEDGGIFGEQCRAECGPGQHRRTAPRQLSANPPDQRQKAK